MATLPKRRIGKTKVEVTTLGLGGAPMGGFRATIPDMQAARLIETAWQAGVRYYDTSPFYGYGRSELRMGGALRDRPRAESSSRRSWRPKPSPDSTTGPATIPPSRFLVAWLLRCSTPSSPHRPAPHCIE